MLLALTILATFLVGTIAIYAIFAWLGKRDRRPTVGHRR